jgi:hypothetical protein
MRSWHKRYGGKGLVIIGIHTPEFDFEKDEDNLKKAIKRLKIPYAVVMDNDYKIWSAYDNRWWPRKLVINKDGEIVYDHIGEGGGAQIETEIQTALREIGQDDFPIITPDPMIGGAVHHRLTPETYLGFLHGKIGNSVGYVPGVEQIFTDTQDHADDLVYLHGHWIIEKDQINHTRTLAHSTEYISIRYSAYNLNVVAGSTRKGKLVEILVELDGSALPKDMVGEDVEIVNGKSVLKISEPRMYSVIRSGVYHKGTLRLKTDSGNLALYSMSF